MGRLRTLVLWAAYDELPNAKRRETAKDWDKIPHTHIPHGPALALSALIADTEIWLPVEFRVPVRTAAIAEIASWLVQRPIAGRTP